jgi:hypothetical protein
MSIAESSERMGPFREKISAFESAETAGSYNDTRGVTSRQNYSAKLIRVEILAVGVTHRREQS